MYALKSLDKMDLCTQFLDIPCDTHDPSDFVFFTDCFSRIITTYECKQNKKKKIETKILRYISLEL